MNAKRSSDPAGTVREAYGGKAKATYDPEADAIGIYFRPAGAEYRDSEEVAPGLTLDYDAEGRVIGVEILGVQRLRQERVLGGDDDAPVAEQPAAE